LLASPADLEQPLPDGYPSIQAPEGGGWLPEPRSALPFRSIVAASRNDLLARFSAFARTWGSRLVDLDEIGHLNPASGFGDWPQADAFVRELDASEAECGPEQPRRSRAC
jgi:serine hydrolase